MQFGNFCVISHLRVLKHTSADLLWASFWWMSVDDFVRGVSITSVSKINLFLLNHSGSFFFGRLTCILLILLYRSNAVELLSYSRYITICNCCLNAPKSLWIPQLTASDHRVDPHLWSNHFKVNKNPVHWTKSLLHKAAIILVVLWRLILENFLYQEGPRVTCTILNGQLFIL